ncbi:MAG: NADH-quinone oxidoreductase subunit L [Thermoflexales bacterium]|nr:NADH-quinone oxidoreductase subunit L [Thermoflexales bacterium]
MMQALILLTIGLPWLGAVCVWLAGDKRANMQHALAVVFSVAAGVTALLMLPQTSSAAAVTIEMGGAFGALTFTPDGLGVFLTVVATVVGSLAVLFSVDYMRGEAQLGRYYALILLFIGAMAGLALTGSLLFLFVFWEITALCSYALISFHNDDPKAVAGGLKALIITSLGGVGLLLGALIVYANTGSYQIADFLAKAESLPKDLLALVAFGFLAAAAAKSAQFPFQTWLPDAMEAPTPVSALIHAATMVNAGVYLLARFYPAFEAVPGWKTAVVVVGLITALMAAFMALVANDLKRVLAYSTVSQLGYMVYSIGVGGVYASQFHLLSHAVFKALLFLAAGAVIHSVGTRDMRLMGGLGKKLPFVRAAFVIGALALMGIPILNGFWSKELILEEGLKDGPVWAYIGMLIGAGITALYTFRMVWLVFFGSERSHLHAHDAQTAMKVSLGLLSFGTLTTWLLAGPFSELLHDTLPFHEIHALPTTEILQEVLSLPTLIALNAVAIGLVLWWTRDFWKGLVNRAQGVAQMARDSFGFEAINRGVVRVTVQSAEALRTTQTGLLNWNVAGIIGGLIVVLIVLMVGR